MARLSWYIGTLLGLVCLGPSIALAQTRTSTSGLPQSLKNTPFSVQADRLEALPKEGKYLAEGQVIITRGDERLYANKVELDRRRGIARALGEVLMVQGRSVFQCREVQMELPELLGELSGTQLHIKRGLDAASLRKVPKEQWLEAGRDELILTAQTAKRVDKRRFDIEKGSFTACDCGPNSSATWRIGAEEAQLDLDSGVFLKWPVFYVHEVPIFILPAFFYPLGERRSGFLVPRYQASATIGSMVAQPIFWAAHRSFDMTFEPRIASQRGPGLGVEARWRPRVDTLGQIQSSWLLDYGAQGSDGGWGWDRSEPLLRFAVSGKHQSAHSFGQVSAQLNMVSDPAYLSEFADAFLQRQTEYTRSRINYNYLGDTFYGGVSLHLLQDLRAASYAPSGQLLKETSLLGDSEGARLIRYRPAELSLNLLPQSIFGTRVSSLLKVDLFSAPRAEQTRFARFHLRPQWKAAFNPGLGLTIEPELALHLTSWVGRRLREDLSAARAAPIGKLKIGQHLSRRYQSLIHSLRPSLRWVSIPKIWSDELSAFNTYDEVHLLSEAHQAWAEIDSSWFQLNGRRQGGFKVGFGQVFDGEDLKKSHSEILSQADLRLGFGEFSNYIDVRSAVRVEPFELTELRIIGGLSFRRFHSLQIQYAHYGDRPPDYSLVGAEELVHASTFDWASYGQSTELVPALNWTSLNGLNLFFSSRPLDPLTLSVRVGLSFDGQGAQQAEVFRDAAGTLTWKSTCDCFSASLTVRTARDRDFPDVNFMVDLAQLGKFGG